MKDKIQNLCEEVRDLSLGTKITRLPSPPTPLTFLRDYISPNKPLIISSATLHWPATALWSSDSHLLSSLSHPISLQLTPTGLADSPTPTSIATVFASPHVQPTPFHTALDLIKKSDKKSGFVAYAQQQNDCLRGEFNGLSRDVEMEVGWASEALGCSPEAVNLWIGNGESETWFHKDHYENIYAVVTGEKHFLLLPPTDVHRMYVRDYPAAQYSYSQKTGNFTLELEDPVRNVPWCSINPYPSPETRDTEMSKFPLYFNGPKPFECTVKAGEILYLPSMWFHHVRQTPDSRGLTIAVNYWYDMRFDIKYAYFNFLQSITYTEAHELLDTSENDSDGSTCVENESDDT